MNTVIYNILKEKKLKSSGLFIILRDNGQYETFKAVSGGWGKGSLQRGSYKIVSCYEMDEKEKDRSSFKREGFPWICGMVPKFETDRNQLAVHPDGDVPGTLGCIGIEENDLLCYAMLLELVNKYGSLRLEVV